MSPDRLRQPISAPILEKREAVLENSLWFAGVCARSAKINPGIIRGEYKGTSYLNLAPTITVRNTHQPKFISALSLLYGNDSTSAGVWMIKNKELLRLMLSSMQGLVPDKKSEISAILGVLNEPNSKERTRKIEELSKSIDDKTQIDDYLKLLGEKDYVVGLLEANNYHGTITREGLNFNSGIEVSLTKPNLLYALEKKFGGNIRIKSDNADKVKSDVFAWNLPLSQSRALLKQIEERTWTQRLSSESF